jgi:hypothetical protein
LAIKADEGEAEITGNLFNRFDFVVHFGILVNYILGIIVYLLVNIIDSHPKDAVLAALSILVLNNY